MDSHNHHATLTILETSDLHGSIFPHSYANHEKQELGFAKIAALIRRERESAEHLLLIDNGDLIQGTPLAYHHARLTPNEPNPMVLALNALGYDAGVVGNHEFNYGLDYLGRAMNESRFAWLSANLVDQGGQPFFGKPYLVKSFANGLKVGVLGLTTPYISHWEQPQHIEGIVFEDAVETAKKWVPVLREKEGVDLIVVSYHGGFERDLDSGEPTERLTGENQGYELCMNVPGIDVLLTGHQHRVISGIWNGVYVIQPAHLGRMLGKITLRLEKSGDAWKVTEGSASLLSAEGAEADSEVMKLARPYETKAQEWLDQPMGSIRGDMLVSDPMQTRLRDNALIEFINKVQMEASGAGISNTALFDNVSPGFPERVTMRHVVSNYMYPNTLKVIRISGRDIKDALEQSAEYFLVKEDGTIGVNPSYAEPKPQHYNYDMWEGIEYRLNIAQPVGQRVVKLTRNGVPLNMEEQFDVVMNNYRAAGGGNFYMFQDKPVIKDIQVDVSELIANTILERKEIEATVNHNWEVVAE